MCPGKVRLLDGGENRRALLETDGHVPDHAQPADGDSLLVSSFTSKSPVASTMTKP